MGNTDAPRVSRRWRTARCALVVVLAMTILGPLARLASLIGAPATTTLPDTGWSALWSVLTRSLAMAGAAGALATLGGAVIVGGTLLLRHPGWLIALAGWVLATPSVVLAVPLAGVIGVDPVGLSALAHGVAGMPVAAALIAASSATVRREELLAVVDLGASAVSVWRRVLAPAALPGAALGWAAASMLALTDPSISLALAGSRPLLASHVFHAVTTDAPTAVAARAVRVVVVFAVLVVALFGAWVGRLTVPTPWRSGVIARHLDPHWIVRGSAVGLGLGLAVMLVTVVLRAVRWERGSSHLGATVASSATVAVLVVVASLVVGGATAALSYGNGRAVDPLMLGLALLSPVAVGVVVAVVHRVPLAVGPIRLPALVGGGAPLSGMLAVWLCFGALGVPLAHVMIGAGLRRTSGLAEVACGLGAGRLRTAASVLLPALGPQMIVAVAVLASIVLTRVTPVVFVQPPEVMLAAPRLVTLVGAGMADEAAALSLAMTAVALVPVALATLVVKRSWRWG